MLEITCVFPQPEGWMVENPRTLPYARLRFADWVIKGPREKLDRAILAEVRGIVMDLRRAFPDMDFRKVRVEPTAWWFGDDDVEVQRPLDTIDYAVTEAVRWRLSEA